MSDNNKLVLNSLKINPKGLTAYKILNLLQKSKSIQPMTVYRALKNLTKNGLIHKTNKNTHQNTAMVGLMNVKRHDVDVDKMIDEINTDVYRVPDEDNPMMNQNMFMNGMMFPVRVY